MLRKRQYLNVIVVAQWFIIFEINLQFEKKLKWKNCKLTKMDNLYYVAKDGTKKKICEMSGPDLRKSLQDEICNYKSQFTDSATRMSKTVENLDQENLKYLLSNHVQNPRVLKSRLAIESEMISPGQIKFYL